MSDFCRSCDLLTIENAELRTEIELLRSALASIAELDVHHKDDNGTWTDVGKIARRALEPKP